MHNESTAGASELYTEKGLNENPHIICILAQYKEVRVRSIWVQIELNEIPY